MPIDHTQTVYENIETEGDWDSSTESKENTYINSDGELVLSNFIINEETSSFDFTDDIQFDTGDAFGTLVRCTENFNGDITFYSPDTRNGFSSSGSVKIFLVSPNQDTYRVHKQTYDFQDKEVVFEDINLRKGFLYSFVQTTGTYKSGGRVIDSTNWEDISSSLHNRFFDTLTSSKVKSSYNKPGDKYNGGLKNVLEPILSDKYKLIDDPSSEEYIDDYYRGFVLQNTIINDLRQFEELDLFRMIYNDPRTGKYLNHTDIKDESNVKDSKWFNTSSFVSTNNESDIVIAEDKSKSEALASLAVSQYANKNTYSEEAKNVLVDLIKRYSEGEDILILDEDMDGGFELKQIIEQNSDLNVTVTETTLATYGSGTNYDSPEYDDSPESPSKRYIPTAELDPINISTTISSSISSSSIKSTTKDSTVIADRNLTTSNSIVTYSYSTLQARRKYGTADLQNISSNPVTSLNLFSNVIGLKHYSNAIPTTGIKRESIISDGGTALAYISLADLNSINGSSYTSTNININSKYIYSNSLDSGTYTTSMASSDINIANYDPIDIDSYTYTTPEIINPNITTTTKSLNYSNFIDNYDCVVVQKFGSDGLAKDYLDKLPFDGNKGTIYLDQVGNRSDSFERLKNIRDNPSGVQNINNSNVSYYQCFRDENNPVLNTISDPYRIFTGIYNTEYADYVSISGYSGDSLAKAHGKVNISEVFGFSRVKFTKKDKESVDQGLWRYGLIDDYSLFDVTGENYIRWSGIQNNKSYFDVQVSKDNSNWVSCENGESIPLIYEGDDTKTKLYLRIKFYNSVTNYTSKVSNLEFLIDENSAKFQFCKSSPITSNPNKTALKHTVNMNTFEAVQNGYSSNIDKAKISFNSLNGYVSDGDVITIPIEASNRPIKWKIKSPGSNTLKRFGDVYEVTRMFDTLKMKFASGEQNMNDIVRPMYTNAGRSRTISLSSGLARAIDLTKNEKNTYTLLPPYPIEPPFDKQEFVLSKYNESISDNKGDKYDVELVFKPKYPIESKKYKNKYAINQNQTPNQWNFEFRTGNIATVSVQSNIESTVKKGVKLSTVNLVLSNRQSRVIKQNLIYNGSTYIENPSDGESYIVDGNKDKRNTIEINPPSDNHEIESGDYIVHDWRIETMQVDNTYNVSIVIAKI